MSSLDRFPSFGFAPSETRRLLRERWKAKLRPYYSGTVVTTREPNISDTSMLQLCRRIEVSHDRERTSAEAIYSAVPRAANDANDLKALAAEGWVRVLWGRVNIAQPLHSAIEKAEGRRPLKALKDRIFTSTHQVLPGRPAIKGIAQLLRKVRQGKTDPFKLKCQTPGWVAARLWEDEVKSASGATLNLRRWTDRWGMLGWPEFSPQSVWCTDDADAFRSTVLALIAIEPGLGGWEETRDAYLRGMSLSRARPSADLQSFFPPVPQTLLDRVLWLGDQVVQTCWFEWHHAFDVFLGLTRLLWVDVASADRSPSPHPIAQQLIDLASNRPELMQGLLFQIHARPALLADAVLHPPTAAIACLEIARWHSSSGASDRELSELDDMISRSVAFADAAWVLGQHVRNGHPIASEVAALVRWFQQSAGPSFIDDVVGNDELLMVLLRELGGVDRQVLRTMAESLHGPGLHAGLGTPEFATFLLLVDLGELGDDIDAAEIVNAYVESIQRGDYGLQAQRIGVASAVALARLASQSTTLRTRFLGALNVRDRLAAASSDDNPFILAESIARSIRAHIRVLCRALRGSHVQVPDDLVNALVVAVRAGATNHQEKGRVASFAPHFEHSTIGAVRDRPIAADIGAAMSVLSAAQHSALLKGILEIDEPHLLAQLLSYLPYSTHAALKKRITDLSIAEAGAIRSLDEMQARINELLGAGLSDAAEQYIEAETSLGTLSVVPGRELTRFQNRLRLLFLRGDWEAIRTTESPAFEAPFEQTAANDALKSFKGLAALKGSASNPVMAKEIFAALFASRSDASDAINWFAAEISNLLSADGFTLLLGSSIRDGRKALDEFDRMLAKARNTSDSARETAASNKALLLLAMGEPERALATLSSAPAIRLQATTAAYRAVALARQGQRNQALALLDATVHTYGASPILTNARQHIQLGTGFVLTTHVTSHDNSLQEVMAAIGRFKSMNPSDQARILHHGENPLEGLVVDYVRRAADSIVSLVPMMKVVDIDSCEDDVTAVVQHLLGARIQFLGWSSEDQSKGGFSAKGNPGERDLLIKWGNSILAILEAIVCDKPLTQDAMLADLESHFQKLFGYGQTTLLFHLTYAYIDDLSSLRTSLEEMASLRAPTGFSFIAIDPIPLEDSRPPGFIARYKGEQTQIQVVFLILNLGQRHQRDAAKMAAETKGRKAPLKAAVLGKDAVGKATKVRAPKTSKS